MRLRTFDANDMNHALKLVRDELGDDAVIISTTRIPGSKGVKVTAAVERPDDTPSGIMVLNQTRKESTLRELSSALQFHSIPTYLIEKIIETARYTEFTSSLSALAKTLGLLFGFSPIRLDDLEEPIILIGPPGVGKTITVAKLAAEATIKKIPVRVITTDCKRAGGIEQLKAFTDILGIKLEVAEKAADLAHIIHKKFDGVTLIDSAGTNPYNPSEIRECAELLDASEAEPVLVMSSGTDTNEAADTSEVFSKLGASRMIITRISSAKRFGSIITAANAAKIAFSGISGTSSVGSKIEPLDPKILAALFLKHKIQRAKK